MKTTIEKGSYGYLDKNRGREWMKAVLMLSVPLALFLVSWVLYKTRMNVMTVVAATGCLPGCNQAVRALMASRYPSIGQELYEQTEAARGERMVLYENVLTAYEEIYYIDCLVISGRDLAGYSSDEKTDAAKAAEHIEGILKKNSYRQNVKIFKDKKAFLERVRALSLAQEEEVPFREDARCPGLGRDGVIRYLLLAVSL